MLLVACSGSLKSADPGTAGIGGDAGTSGHPGIGGDAGAASRADAGTAGTSGTFGGDAGTSGTCTFPFNGPGCPPGNCVAGTGSCGVPPSGSAGSGGIGRAGRGGTVGTTPALPACQPGAPSFGVCFVSDADVLPLPAPPSDQGTRTSGAATIVDVGTGAAPASCESARVFGERGPSDWWFQAKAADNHVWTIGVHGLGGALVAKNDTVTLDLDWRGYQISGFGPPSGALQLSDATATPLLWAGAEKNTATWLTLMPGPATCALSTACDVSRRDVVVEVNGSQSTLPPYGAATVGGYYVAIGQSVQTVAATQCPDYFGPGFAAAAAKVPAGRSAP